MDITQIILDQHARQREFFAQLQSWPKDDTEGLEAMWTRLEIFLETHAEAEERFVYPHLLQHGEGVADADDGTVEGEVEDSVSDHNKIREAVRKVKAATTGSKEWWDAVTEADVQNSKHMGEEERQDLRDLRENTGLEQREQMAIEFLRFEAQCAAEGVKVLDKDPEKYVEDPKAELAKKAPAKKA